MTDCHTSLEGIKRIVFHWLSQFLAPAYMANMKLEIFFADILTDCFSNHRPDVICGFVDLPKTFLRLFLFVACVTYIKQGGHAAAICIKLCRS